MQRAVTAWLNQQIDIELEGERSVERLALRIANKAVAVACIVNAGVHCALAWASLLPYPLAPALFVGFCTTATIGFAVSFLFMLMIGHAIRKLAIQRDAFEHLSCTDMLSGVRNRRAFFECFEETPEAGEFILIDIDRFKAINDTYGHLAGDEVIRGVGQALRAVFVGTPAVIGRVGGEEFAVFLPDTASSRLDYAEASREAVAAMVVEGIERPITISIGSATSEPPRPAIEVYAGADRALYLAKAGGRNRVVREADICTPPRLHDVPAVEEVPPAVMQPNSA